MPGKHVRFSRTLTVHSPPTPALTTSSFSPASSGSVLTPPSRSHTLPGPSPYNNMSFPKVPLMAPPTLIHILLQPSRSPALVYDLTQPPSTVTSYQRGISMRVLSEPATQPPLSSMTILNPHFPWAISIHPSSHAGGFVTVQDVLDGVYRKLRTGITSQEYYALPGEKEKRRVTMAYEQRYRRIRSSREYEEEKRRGVRRSDFLGGHTRFLGLSPSSQGPSVWHLDTA